MGAAIVEGCGDCKSVTIDWTGIDKIRISIAMRVMQELVYVIHPNVEGAAIFTGMSSGMITVFNKAQNRWVGDDIGFITRAIVNGGRVLKIVVPPSGHQPL